MATDVTREFDINGRRFPVRFTPREGGGGYIARASGKTGELTAEGHFQIARKGIIEAIKREFFPNVVEKPKPKPALAEPVAEAETEATEKKSKPRVIHKVGKAKVEQ